MALEAIDLTVPRKNFLLDDFLFISTFQVRLGNILKFGVVNCFRLWNHFTSCIPLCYYLQK